MKDILIFGAPRTGKTTLSRLLYEELENYNVLAIDAIRNAFRDIFPELELMIEMIQKVKTCYLII